MYQQSNRGQEYRQQDLAGASPIRLVVMAYDLAIHACEQEDFQRAVRAVGVLRDALNFDYAEASVGLFRLYQWVMDLIRSGNYKAASDTLKELREAWMTAEKNLESKPAGEKPKMYSQPGQTSGTIAQA